MQTLNVTAGAGQEKRIFPIVTDLSEYVRAVSAKLMREAQEAAAAREMMGPQVNDPALIAALQQYAAKDEDTDAFSVLDLTDPENYFAKMQMLNMQKEAEPETKTQSEIETEKANGRTEKTEKKAAKTRPAEKEKPKDSRGRNEEKDRDEKPGPRADKADAPERADRPSGKEEKAEKPRKNTRGRLRRGRSAQPGMTQEGSRAEKEMGIQEKSTKMMETQKSAISASEHERDSEKASDRNDRGTEADGRKEPADSSRTDMPAQRDNRTAIQKEAELNREDRSKALEKEDAVKSPTKEALDNSMRTERRDLTNKTAESMLHKTVVRGTILESLVSMNAARAHEAPDRKPQEKEGTDKKRADTRGAKYRQAVSREAGRAERAAEQIKTPERETPQVDAKIQGLAKDRYRAGADNIEEKQTLKARENVSEQQKAPENSRVLQREPGQNMQPQAQQKEFSELSAANPTRDVSDTLAFAREMSAAGVLMKDAAMFTHTFDRPVQFRLGNDTLKFEKEGKGDEAETFALLNGQKISGDDATRFFVNLQRAMGPVQMGMIAKQLSMASRDPYQGKTKELLSKAVPQEGIKKAQNLMRN